MDKYLDCYKQDEGDELQNDSSKNCDFSNYDKISLPPNNQLTVSTIVSISSEFNSCQDIGSKIGKFSFISSLILLYILGLGQ